MRAGVWVGTLGLAAAAAIGGFLTLQPAAQAEDDMQTAVVACQRSLETWSALSSGTPAPSRAIAGDALEAAVRCGHRATEHDLRLAGRS